MKQLPIGECITDHDARARAVVLLTVWILQIYKLAFGNSAVVSTDIVFAKASKIYADASSRCALWCALHEQRYLRLSCSHCCGSVPSISLFDLYVLACAALSNVGYVETSRSPVNIDSSDNTARSFRTSSEQFASEGEKRPR